MLSEDLYTAPLEFGRFAGMLKVKLPGIPLPDVGATLLDATEDDELPAAFVAITVNV